VSDNWRKLLFPVLAVAVVAVFLLIPRGQANDSEQILFPELPDLIEEVVEESVLPIHVPTILVVDVKGAVVRPGVYTLQEGDRLIDAINAAGGYRPEADSRMLNHAMKLSDEFLVYVPVEGEEVPVGETNLVVGAADTQAKDGTVNINTADESQLMTISGIGPSKASAIIKYRDEHGPFTATESLMKISGIGKKTFEKLENQITVK